jgi:hypothetical protein
MRLRLDKEIREIEAGLQRGRIRDNLRCVQKWAVRADDIQRAMLETRPQIVHFSGHGEGEQGIIIEDDSGKPTLASSEALSGLFELFPEVECILLNACYTEFQASVISKHVPHVIGMNDSIGDDAALKFSIGFYDGIGDGQSVEFAYKLGCNRIHLAGIPEHLTPILKIREPGPHTKGEANAHTNHNATRNLNDKDPDDWIKVGAEQGLLRRIISWFADESP